MVQRINSFGKQRDNVLEETRVVSVMNRHLGTDARIKDEMGNRPLPHLIRKQRLTVKTIQVQATEEKGFQTIGAEFRVVTENLITRHLIIGILPCVKITSLRQDAYRVFRLLGGFFSTYSAGFSNFTFSLGF